MGWAARGACAGRDTSMFYGDPQEGATRKYNSEEDMRIRAAISVCQRCPVRQECLTHALRYPEPWGIWGGMTPSQRTHLRTRVMNQRKEVAR